jgi:hypothetical protein
MTSAIGSQIKEEKKVFNKRGIAVVKENTLWRKDHLKH